MEPVDTNSKELQELKSEFNDLKETLSEQRIVNKGLLEHTRDGQTFIRRRGSGDIWQGLFEFPMIESEKPLTTREIEQRLNCQSSIVNCQLQLVAQGVLHQLTHQRLHADFYYLTLEDPLPFLREESSIVNYQLVKESDLDNYAFPRLLVKLLEKIKL